MTRAAVSGALGRMGSLASRAIEAAADLEYAGGFARISAPGESIYDDVQRLLLEQRPHVVVDFTPRPVSQRVSRAALETGAHVVIGSSEWDEAERAELARQAERAQRAALFVPNFAIGAVLMMRFAQEAAPYFSGAEIVEMHRADKRDKPSGTAAATARRISAGFDGDVPIHSVRLPGLLAHQAVLFGNPGETLTLRHDSLSRESFAGGILAAVRGVAALPPGLHEGLECVLG